MTIFYFTGTGNSLAVAKKIGGEEAKLISIPQIIDSDTTHYKDDVIGLVFPIYGFDAPQMVRKFLDRVKLEAGYTFTIGTYGNIAGGAMRLVQKRAVKNGYGFDYANSLLMVDNFLPIFEIGKQVDKLPQKNVEASLDKIIADINERKMIKKRVSPIAGTSGSLFSCFMGSGKYPHKRFRINERCNQCGICAKVCPAKNIEVASKVEFSTLCERCFACLHLCPQNALHHKKQKSEQRWIHPDVSLKDIIAANNRTTAVERDRGGQ